MAGKGSGVGRVLNETVFKDRGISPDDISRYGLMVVSPGEAHALGFGSSDFRIPSDVAVIPYYDLDGKEMEYSAVVGDRETIVPVQRIRILKPEPDGPKYLSRYNAGTQLFIPKGLRSVLSRVNTVVFTEGEFKAIAGTKYGFPTCGIQGVSCWHNSSETTRVNEVCKTTLDEDLWLDGCRKPLLPDICKVLRLDREVWEQPRSAYILGDSDLLWNPRSHGARELNTMAEAIRWQVATRTAVGCCPPILELRWLLENGDRLADLMDDKKMSAKYQQIVCDLREICGANPSSEVAASKAVVELIRDVANILEKFCKDGFNELKRHKTGLDDWLQMSDDSVDAVYSQIMRDLEMSGTSAVTIKYMPGQLDKVVHDVYSILEAAPTDNTRIYALDGRLPVTIDWVCGHPVVAPVESPDDLTLPLTSRVRFQSVVPPKHKEKQPSSTSTLFQYREIPKTVLHALYSRGARWSDKISAYPELRGVRTAPLVDLNTGKMTVLREGYRDGYYWYVPDVDAYKPYLKKSPTDDEMRRAVDFFYRPFRESPWADSSSASGVLAMALTMLIRDALDIAPGFVITAPQAETGKSFVAEIAAQIVYGLATDTLPVIDALQWRVNNKGQLDEEELGKVLFSALRERNGILYFDNIPNGGMLGCAEIDRLITNSYISGRILAQSSVKKLRTAATFVATGNNLEIVADTRTRMVLLRQEKMFNSRHFSREKHEWLGEIRENTVKYRGSLLLILRWILSHRDEIKRALLPSVQCRFPKWNEVVRCGVILAGQHGAAWHPEAGGRLEDPMEAIKKYNIDTKEDKFSAMFKALRAVFGGNKFSTNNIVSIAKKQDISAVEYTLIESLDVPDRFRVSSTRVGMLLSRLRGQVYDGLKLVHLGQDSATKAHLYKVDVFGGGFDNNGPKNGGNYSDNSAGDPSTGGPDLLACPSVEPEKTSADNSGSVSTVCVDLDNAPEPSVETPQDNLPDSESGDVAGNKKKSGKKRGVSKGKRSLAKVGKKVFAESLPDVEPPPSPFLVELTDVVRSELAEASWLSLDTETTGLSPNGKTLLSTPSTPIGDMKWKDYVKTYGKGWNGAPRLRVLTVTPPSGEPMAFDLDRMDPEARKALLKLCVSGKILVGHNLAFDLQWIRAEVCDVWPDRVLDTMLLVRALAPSLSIKLHVDAVDEDNDDNVRRAAAALVEATKNKTCGTKLIEVATALGVEMPEGKLWQRPEAWAVENLSESHYRYATGDTTVVLDVLIRLASHVGLQANDPAEFIRACEEQRPAGWECYVDVFEAGLRSLTLLHDAGLPFDAEAARGHIQRLDEEMAGPVAELIELAPGLTPHLATIVCGGLTHKVKNAFIRAVEAESPEIAKEIVRRTVKDGEHEGDLDAAVEVAWQKLMDGQDIPNLKIGQKELPVGAKNLKFLGPWNKVQDAAKRRAMLKTILDCVRADGRLHPRIGIVTVTGRTNSEDPNVQNFPRDPWFRELVRAEDGNVLIAADYSALEMRVAAALAVRAVRWYGPAGILRDRYDEAFSNAVNAKGSFAREMILEPLERVVSSLEALNWRLPLAEVFRADIDPHVATAMVLMRASHAEELPDGMPDDVIGWLAGMTSEERKQMRKLVGVWRQRAKAANFGLLYGQQAAGLHRYAQQSYGVEWTLEEAEHTREVWFSSYPDIYFWQLCSDLVDKRWTGGFLARNKYSRRIETKNSPVRVSSTLSGRPLSTLDRTSILNHQDQGSGAEIALRAVNLLPEEWRGRVVNFVHDEIMLEVPEIEAERAAEALRDAMVRAGDWLLGPFGIPTEVDVAVGRTWPKG